MPRAIGVFVATWLLVLTGLLCTSLGLIIEVRARSMWARILGGVPLATGALLLIVAIWGAFTRPPAAQ